MAPTRSWLSKPVSWPLLIAVWVACWAVAGACGVVDAIESFFVSSEEAAQAATATAEQTTSTLHALEHFLLFSLPAYVVGTVQMPVWGKMKAMRDRKKSKKAKQP